MKIYTKKGDNGTTTLIGANWPKYGPLMEAIGDVDELNAFIGKLQTWSHDYWPTITDIQNSLMQIGTLLADLINKRDTSHLDKATEQLEKWIDEKESYLTPLNNFILPQGSPAITDCHVARAVCRRAERRVWALMVNDSKYYIQSIGRYLNRLSDALFILARDRHNDAACEEEEEITWTWPEENSETGYVWSDKDSVVTDALKQIKFSDEIHLELDEN